MSSSDQAAAVFNSAHPNPASPSSSELPERTLGTRGAGSAPTLTVTTLSYGLTRAPTACPQWGAFYSDGKAVCGGCLHQHVTRTGRWSITRKARGCSGRLRATDGPHRSLVGILQQDLGAGRPTSERDPKSPTTRCPVVHLRPPRHSFEPGRAEDERCRGSPCHTQLLETSLKSCHLGRQDAGSPNMAKGATKTQGQLVPCAQLAGQTNFNPGGKVTISPKNSFHFRWP